MRFLLLNAQICFLARSDKGRYHADDAENAISGKNSTLKLIERIRRNIEPQQLPQVLKIFKRVETHNLIVLPSGLLTYFPSNQLGNIKDVPSAFESLCNSLKYIRNKNIQSRSSVMKYVKI